MVEIFTDGGIKKAEKKGSWAFVVTLQGKEEYCESGVVEDTTSNRMEITAILNAIKFCIDNSISGAKIFSDSEYSVNSFNEWMHGWGWNGWRTATGKEVSNKDLWLEASQLKTNKMCPKLEWVKGHAGIEFNERADYLCNKELGRR